MPDTAALKKSAAKTTPIDAGVVITVPIGRCEVAPENPRAGREVEDLDAITGSIEASLADGGPGVLQAGICYEEKGRWWFTAGRRRLAGARAAGLTQFPALVQEKEAAIRAGLQEQTNHVTMHPADEAKAFARELKTRDVKEIANAYRVSEAIVRQRAALASLHPPIFEAFAADEITLAQAKAWANAPAERQAALSKRIGINADSAHVTDELHDGKLEGNDRLALFVGEEAYRAAGGQVEQQLFGENELDPYYDPEIDGEPTPPAAYWLDRDLAEKLSAEKLDGIVAKKRKEGWGFVETAERVDWSRYDRGPACKTKDQKAEAGVVIVIDHAGKPEITRDLHLRKGASASSTTGPAEAKPAISAAAHEAATEVAARILGRSIATNSDAALIAVCAHLARQHFHQGNYYTGTETLRLSPTSGAYRDPQWPALKSDTAWALAGKKWEEKLDGKWNSAESEIASWTKREQQHFFAFLVGSLVTAFEPRGAGSAERRKRLAALADVAGVGTGPAALPPHKHWTPDARWFKGCSREQLAAWCEELAVTEQPTKGATADLLERAARDQNWLPPLILEFCGMAPLSLTSEPDDDEDDEDQDDSDDGEEDEDGEQTQLEDFTAGRPAPSNRKRR